MIVSKTDFQNSSAEEIVKRLNLEITTATESEINSWENTVKTLKTFTNNIKENFIVILEQSLPFSLRRIDAILCYQHNNGYHLDFFEFKQWTNDNLICVDNENVHLNFDSEPRIHPFYQVNQYLEMLKYSFSNFTNVFNTHRLYVVLPNYDLDKDQKILNIDPSFIEEEPIILSLGRLIYNSPSLNVININQDFKNIDPFELLNFRNNPDLIDEIFKYDKFQLYGGEEEAAKTAILNINNSKDVVINGYAGSGKTAIGLYLLNRIIKSKGKKWNLIYASASEIRAFFSSKFSDGKESLFKVFGQAISNVQNNTLILLDEAHRMYNSQVDSLLKNTNYKNVRIIWLIDDYQSFGIGEDNKTETLIEKYNSENRDIIEIQLTDTQFRYGNRREYVPTVLSMFTDNPKTIDNPDIIISDSITQSIEWYRNARLSKGIVASDSWKAGKINIDGVYLDSIKDFGSWSKLDNADSPASAYKCQGNSKDNILFLWGQEFVYRNKIGWVIQPEYVKEKKWDSYLSKFGKLNSKDKSYIYEKFRNLYYVLMTRFNISMNIFCVDVETREYLKHVFGNE